MCEFSVIGLTDLWYGLVDHGEEFSDYQVEIDAYFTGPVTLDACHVST
jgi:hypothetical protein